MCCLWNDGGGKKCVFNLLSSYSFQFVIRRTPAVTPFFPYYRQPNTSTKKFCIIHEKKLLKNRNGTNCRRKREWHDEHAYFDGFRLSLSHVKLNFQAALMCSAGKVCAASHYTSKHRYACFIHKHLQRHNLCAYSFCQALMNMWKSSPKPCMHTFVHTFSLDLVL